MSFTQAALIIVALAAIGLGLVAYHLLSRLDALEQAIEGGMVPPGRRLARHEFEQRFGQALARSQIARRVDNGLVIVVGAEGAESDVAGALAELPRGDGLFTIASHEHASAFLDQLDLPGSVRLDDADLVAAPATPFLLVIDDGRVRHARPIPTGAELLQALATYG